MRIFVLRAVATCKNVIKNKKEAGEVKNLRFMLKLASKK